MLRDWPSAEMVPRVRMTPIPTVSSGAITPIRVRKETASTIVRMMVIRGGVQIRSSTSRSTMANLK